MTIAKVHPYESHLIAAADEVIRLRGALAGALGGQKLAMEGMDLLRQQLAGLRAERDGATETASAWARLGWLAVGMPAAWLIGWYWVDFL